jgi:membrane protease YdiL (CAAX protease family)
MLGTILVTVIALILLAAIKTISERFSRMPGADICAGICSLLAYLMIAHRLCGIYTSAILSDVPRSMLLITGTGLLSLSGLIYIGLVKLWPISKSDVPFMPRITVAGSLAGFSVGLIMSTAMTTTWINFHGLPKDFLGMLLLSNTVPMSIAEEFLFRGRVTQIIDARVSSKCRVNMLQATVFAVAHLHGILFFLPQYGIVVKQLACVYVLGCVYGLLAAHFRSYWPSILAHVCYNTVVMINVLS